MPQPSLFNFVGKPATHTVTNSRLPQSGSERPSDPNGTCIYYAGAWLHLNKLRRQRGTKSTFSKLTRSFPANRGKVRPLHSGRQLPRSLFAVLDNFHQMKRGHGDDQV